MKIEFDVKLETKDLYAFNMAQAYKGMQGLISILFPALIFGYTIYNWNNADVTDSLVNIGIGLILLIYMPISLLLRSARIVKTGEVLSKPLHYVVTEESIEVSQGEDEAILEWGSIYRLTAGNKRILIYTNRINAYIIPKAQMDGQSEAFVALAQRKLDKYRIKA